MEKYELVDKKGGKNEFDAILISEFETMKDLETYKNHP